MKNEILIRKMDLLGEPYLGRIHTSDLSFEMKRSADILKRNSNLVIKNEDGTTGFFAYRTEVIPSGADYELRWNTRIIKSKGIDVWTDGRKFRVSKEGLYFVACNDGTQLPIETQVMETTLKLKVNNLIYVLDSQPNYIYLVGGGGGYHHFVFLNGFTFLYFKKEDVFSFYFNFQSQINTNLDTYHTRYCYIRYLGDGWAE